jgi:pimeloyl-ACP methyl ester carboxylesterase
LRELSTMRSCIAVDLLAHGATEIQSTQDVASIANATMLEQFLDALGIHKIDLVGNDSGGGIALIFAANNPDRIASLTLTDCDAHDNWPPQAFKPFLELSAKGGLSSALGRMLWGTDDIFFDLKWSRWLAPTIPGTRCHADFEGARLYLPEERWQAFNAELRDHWAIKKSARETY